MRLKVGADQDAIEMFAAADPAFILRCGRIEPEPWQLDICRCKDPRILLLICRQVGKSTTAAAIGISRMLQHPDTPVIIAAPTQVQAQEVLRKGRANLRDLGIRATNDSETKIELRNGSRMLAKSDKPESLRSYSNSQLIILDEAAYIDNEIYEAVEPMLAKDGQIMMMSTPFGARGLFYATWKDETGFWRRLKVTAPEVPWKYPPEVLAEKRNDPLMTEAKFAQEYYCEFGDAVDAAFRAEDIENACSDEFGALY